MFEYIDVLLTLNGVFCAAPPWKVREGDLICLPNAVTGKDEMMEVVAVSTDRKDSDNVKMLEKFIGYPLPKITAKYEKSEVEWDVPIQE